MAVLPESDERKNEPKSEKKRSFQTRVRWLIPSLICNFYSRRHHREHRHNSQSETMKGMCVLCEGGDGRRLYLYTAADACILPARPR